jgi:hypothetical protein
VYLPNHGQLGIPIYWLHEAPSPTVFPTAE